MKIDYELKRKCAELANSGIKHRKIYDEVFCKQHTTMSYETFRHKIRGWKKKVPADDKILEAANLDWKFKPFGATVQLNGQGEITQAWIKQSADNNREFEKLIEEIRKNTQPIKIERKPTENNGRMLEIPLYDLHVGIADLNFYLPMVHEVLEIINSQYWERIIITLSQDLFHNDDFRGRTSSGRVIEKVDMVKAWSDAKAIYYAIFGEATKQSKETEALFVRGNHDESMAWAFTQMLKERYKSVSFDDSLAYRKVRTFGKNFIGFTHGNAKKSTPRDMREQFTISFPIEFAGANVREIHAGHFHVEKSCDEYGVMCRTLCTGNKTDDWSDSEGYIGAIKRFMLFEWSKDKLAAIHYV